MTLFPCSHYHVQDYLEDLSEEQCGERGAILTSGKTFLIQTSHHWHVLSGPVFYLLFHFNTLSMLLLPSVSSISCQNHLHKPICTRTLAGPRFFGGIIWIFKERIRKGSSWGFYALPVQIPVSLCVRSAQRCALIRHFSLRFVFYSWELSEITRLLTHPFHISESAIKIPRKLHLI